MRISRILYYVGFIRCVRCAAGYAGCAAEYAECAAGYEGCASGYAGYATHQRVGDLTGLGFTVTHIVEIG